MSILWRTFFSRRWLWLLLPVVVCLALTVFDTRFAFVALILAMAAVMVAMPVGYYYALTPESRWSILEKTINLTDEGLTLSFASEKMNEHNILWSEIASTTAMNECVVIKLKKNKYTFLAVPLSAFDGKEHLRSFVLAIRDKIDC